MVSYPVAADAVPSPITAIDGWITSLIHDHPDLGPAASVAGLFLSGGMAGSVPPVM
jgi:hypothetical protein